MQIRIRKLLVMFLGVCMLLLVIGETGAAPANVVVHTALINVYGVHVDVVNLISGAPGNPNNIIVPDNMLNVNHGVINTGDYWNGAKDAEENEQYNGIYVRVQYDLINDKNYLWSDFDAELADGWKPGYDKYGKEYYYYTKPILADPAGNPKPVEILKYRYYNSDINKPYTMYVPYQWTSADIPKRVSVSVSVQAVQVRNFNVDFNRPDGNYWPEFS